MKAKIIEAPYDSTNAKERQMPHMGIDATPLLNTPPVMEQDSRDMVLKKNTNS
jgi:hypothetical protein